MLQLYGTLLALHSAPQHRTSHWNYKYANILSSFADMRYNDFHVKIESVRKNKCFPFTWYNFQRSYRHMIYRRSNHHITHTQAHRIQLEFNALEGKNYIEMIWWIRNSHFSSSIFSGIALDVARLIAYNLSAKTHKSYGYTVPFAIHTIHI